MTDGFFFEELSEFKQDLLREASEVFTKETETFLKKEGRKLSNIQKNIAKQDVGTTGKNGDKSYHKRFKVSKIYGNQGDKFLKALNSSPHAHLIEYGHKSTNGKFVPGRYVMKSSENQFKHEFEKDCDEFLGEYFDEIGEHK